VIIYRQGWTFLNFLYDMMILYDNYVTKVLRRFT